MSTTPETPATPAPTKQAGTEYVILYEDTNGRWVLPQWDNGAKTIRAANVNDALKKAVKPGDEDASQRFVAVPARSWRPVTVTVETVSRVRLEDA